MGHLPGLESYHALSTAEANSIPIRRGQGIDDGAAWVRAKLTRSWGKLDPRVRQEAEGAYRAALAVLGRGGGAD